MTAEEYKASFEVYPRPIGLDQWVSDYNAMRVHTQGSDPGELISKARPNEPQDVRQYRIDNYRCVTMSSFVQAKTNLKRTLSHSSVEIMYPDKIKDFLNEPRFEDTDFLSYMQKWEVDRMIDAANGLLVWWPTNVGDTSQQLGVRPINIFPPDILHYSPDVLTWLSDEKSPVTVGKEVKMEGLVYYIILKDELWKRIQVGNVDKEEYEWVVYSKNLFNEVFALVLGGDEVVKVDEKTGKEIRVFQSFFSLALPFANETLTRHSDAQGTWISCASPIREVDPVDCNLCGTTGKVSRTNHFGHPIPGYSLCSNCNGQGYTIPTSSYGMIVRAKVKGKVGDPDTVSERKGIEFLHPDVSILEYGGKSWQEYLSLTDDSLNLLFIEEAQSGVAKEIDREDKLSTLDKIGVHLYKYLIVQSIQIIHKWLYPGDDYPEVTVNLPSTFIIKTESELIDDLGKLRTQNAPDFMLAEVMRDVVSKRFGGDPVRMKIYDVLIAIDPLYTKTDSQRASMLANGGISELSYQFSIYAYPVVSAYARDNQGFHQMSIESIIAAVTPLILAQVQVQQDAIQQAIDREATRIGSTGF